LEEKEARRNWEREGGGVVPVLVGIAAAVRWGGDYI
jgi:hypothetical protein